MCLWFPRQPGPEESVVSSSAACDRRPSWHGRLPRGETKWPHVGRLLPTSRPTSRSTSYPAFISRCPEGLESRRIPVSPASLLKCVRLFQVGPAARAAPADAVINVPFTLLSFLVPPRTLTARGCFPEADTHHAAPTPTSFSGGGVWGEDSGCQQKEGADRYFSFI